MPLRRRGRPGLVGTEARTAVVAGTATTVSDNVARRQQNRAEEKRAEEKYVQHEDPVQQQAAGMAATPTPVPAAAAAPAPDMVTQLQQLADLKAQGVLTEVEFENAKAKLLNRL